MGAFVPPGPSGRRALRYWAQMLHDPLATYGALRREYGDAVRLPLGGKRSFFMLSRPEHAEHVLVQHQDRYVKAFTYRPLKAFLGAGLLPSEGAVWQRHRRLVQPVFSHRHVRSFAPAIVAAARRRAAQWTPGTSVDMAAEMRTLTMDVTGRVLFGTDLASDAEPVGHAVSRLQGAMVFASLLDLLVAAGLDEQPLRRDEIQDEVMTLVLAGHETTANALTWALTLLSRYPAARDRLAAEVEEVLGDRDPDASDVDALPWTQAVVSETMRLYPPAWTVERDAVQDDNIPGSTCAAGRHGGHFAYLIHRHAEFWPNPEGFDPRRFLSDNAANRPRYAFIPFGGGRRICVGAGLAQLEATLALAVLAQSARLDLAPTAELRARADVTLHPRGPVVATVASPVRAATRVASR